MVLGSGFGRGLWYIQYLAVLDAGCYLLSWVHCDCVPVSDWGSVRTEAVLQHDHDVMAVELGLQSGVNGAVQCS